MTNDKTKPQRSLGTNPFPDWAPRSIWQDSSNHGARGSLQEAAPAVPKPLAQTSETESYRAKLRGADTSTRNTSGSTSPISTRADISYFGAKPQRQAAIGQRSTTYSTTSWSPDANFDMVARQNTQTSDYSSHSNKEQSGARFGQNAGFMPERLGHSSGTATRNLQGTYDHTGTATFTRESSRDKINRPDTDSHAQGTHYGGHPYDFQGGPARQLPRSSFGSDDANTRPATNSSNDLQSLSLGVAGTSLDDFDGAAEPSVNGRFPTSNNTATQPWRFNPATQDWENSIPQVDTKDAHFHFPQGVRAGSGFAASGPSFQGRNGSGISNGTMSMQPLPNLGSVPVTTPNMRRLGGPNLGGHGQQATLPPLLQNYIAPQPYYQSTATPPPFNIQYGSSANMMLPPRDYQHQAPFPHGGFRAGHQNRPSRGYDPADARRSPLLREFRMSHKTNSRYELKHIEFHVVEFCGDQHGSRFIQDKLEKANSDEKEMVFNEIIEDAIPLMKDTFGNYVISKLFEQGTLTQKELLAEKMMDCMTSLTFDTHGCRVVQKALEYVLGNQQGALIRKLEPQVMTIMKHDQGNYVLMKAIEFGRQEDLEFIFRSMRGKVKELACHVHACRVVQKAMRFDDVRASIIDEVVPDALLLANNHYGNYVVQHILEEGTDGDRARIINRLLGSIVHLSKQKHASNVIEKCSTHGTPEQRRKMEAEMMATGPDGKSFLCSMIIDSYANYVVQNHMKTTPDKRAFSAALQSALQSARAAGHTGKHVDTIARVLEETARELGVQEEATASPLGSRHSSVAPTSPLQLLVGSAAPTPNLTMEPNSPSSSPPSTTESAVEDFVSAPLKDCMASANGRRFSPEVQLADDDA